MRRALAVVASVLIVLAACRGSAGEREAGAADPASSTTAPLTVISSTAPLPVTTTTAGPAPATTATAVTRDCQTVGFTPNSEDAASSVRATGVSCSEAEALVRLAGGRTSTGGPARLDVEGYHCVRVRVVEEPLPQAFYECTNGQKTVTFVRS